MAVAQLATFYSSVLYFTGDISTGTLDEPGAPGQIAKLPP